MSVWVFRGVGFLLMLIGFTMIANPIATILSILPVAGNIAGGVIFLVSLVLAAALSIVTILVSMLIHNLIALVVAIIIVIAATIIWLKRRHSRRAVTESRVPPPSSPLPPVPPLSSVPVEPQ
jgi:hypothetical protein